MVNLNKLSLSYLKNGEDQPFFFLLPSKHVKRSAFQSKWLAVSQMAFRSQKVIGTFEKRAPEVKPKQSWLALCVGYV